MEFDHLALSGETLDAATDKIESALGVALVPGGKHDVFGTHNRLLGLEDGLYLEAIAIDPEAPQPARPRWFDLDRFAGDARLTNWVCRVPDLEAALALLPKGVGTPVALARGDLRWRMAVPQDGRLPYDNMCPALITWQGALHPARMLPSSGCRLAHLVVCHPAADEMSRVFGRHLDDSRVVFEAGPVGLRAEFDTPSGRRVLE